MEIVQHVSSHKLTLCMDAAAHPVKVSVIKAVFCYPQVIQTV